MMLVPQIAVMRLAPFSAARRAFALFPCRLPAAWRYLRTSSPAWQQVRQRCAEGRQDFARQSEPAPRIPLKVQPRLATKVPEDKERVVEAPFHSRTLGQRWGAFARLQRRCGKATSLSVRMT